MHEHPAIGAVNGYENIASLGLIWHLWQVVNVDVYENWLIVLEGLLIDIVLSSVLGMTSFKRDMPSPEQASKAGTRHVAMMYWRVT